MKTKNLHKTINPNNRNKNRHRHRVRHQPKTIVEPVIEPATNSIGGNEVAIEINSKSNTFIDGKLVLYKSELEYLVRQITDNDSFTIDVNNNKILNTNIDIGGLEDYVCLDVVLND